MSAEGLLVVHKPSGPTSHDVVAQARRLYRTRAVGHAGTLDPMASGVLILLLGEATKLASYLTLEDKEYLATVALGMGTDTLDALGTPTSEADLAHGWLSEAALERALGAERGRSLQVPPAFSAISVGGVRAYRSARRGEAVDLPARSVKVHSLAVVSHDDRRIVVRMKVSKGYYVRAFARDLAEALGVPGHLAALERLASGPFRIEMAVPWPPEEPPSPLPLAEAARIALPVGLLTDMGAHRAARGQSLGTEHFGELPPHPSEPFAWFAPGGALVAVGRSTDPATFRVARGFRSPS